MVVQLYFDTFTQIFFLLFLYFERITYSGTGYGQFEILFIPVEWRFDLPADGDTSLYVDSFQGIDKDFDNIVFRNLQFDQK